VKARSAAVGTFTTKTDAAVMIVASAATSGLRMSRPWRTTVERRAVAASPITETRIHCVETKRGRRITTW
jgi:hypothetical protein